MPRQGRLHRMLLDALPGDGKVLSVYEVLWKVARKDGEIRRGEIRESYESSVKRALNDLVARGQAVRGASRRIGSLDALCRAYPYRTRREIVFEMRTRLLPLVKEYAAEVPSRKAASDLEASTFWRYSIDKIEEFQMNWRAIDVSMRQLLSRVDVNDVNSIIDLLVRGRQLFDPSASVTSGRTFVEVSDVALPIVQRVDQSAAAELEHLARRMFPHVRVRVALLKREIYKCVTQHKYGPEALLPEFEAFLLERDPPYISSLLTHPSSPRKRAGAPGAITQSEPLRQGERMLDKLLLRDVTKAVPVYGRR